MIRLLYELGSNPSYAYGPERCQCGAKITIASQSLCQPLSGRCCFRAMSVLDFSGRVPKLPRAA